MRKQDRFDDDAMEFVFESMTFRAALEAQNDGELALALATLMRDRYGTDAEVAAAYSKPKAKRKKGPTK